MKSMIVLAFALALFAYSSYAEGYENDQEDGVAANTEATDDEGFEDLEEDEEAVLIQQAAFADYLDSHRRRNRAPLSRWRLIG